MKHIRLIVLMAGVIVTQPAPALADAALLGQVSAQRRALDFLKGLPRA